ncbi:ATP-binding protein, partial [Streptomyces sp. NPDC003860]
MRHRPSRRARRAFASPLFTPHGTDRAGRKKARRQLADATAQARAAANTHPGGSAPAEAE